MAKKKRTVKRKLVPPKKKVARKKRPGPKKGYRQGAKTAKRKTAKRKITANVTAEEMTNAKSSVDALPMVVKASEEAPMGLRLIRLGTAMLDGNSLVGDIAGLAHDCGLSVSLKIDENPNDEKVDRS